MKTEEIDLQDAILMADVNILNMNQVAKILDMGYGRNILFGILRKNQILTCRNEPYQQYINQGYFKLKIKPRPGQPHIYDTVTMVTAKGIKFIEKLLLKENTSNN